MTGVSASSIFLYGECVVVEAEEDTGDEEEGKLAEVGGHTVVGAVCEYHCLHHAVNEYAGEGERKGLDRRRHFGQLCEKQPYQMFSAEIV